jgi:hypothetical protein
MTRLSPELVLVDPALREAALAALPAPRDCLATRRPTPVVALTRSTAPESARVDRDVEHVNRSKLAVPLLALVSGGFLFAYFLGSPVLELLDASRAALPI